MSKSFFLHAAFTLLLLSLIDQFGLDVIQDKLLELLEREVRLVTLQVVLGCFEHELQAIRVDREVCNQAFNLL